MSEPSLNNLVETEVAVLENVRGTLGDLAELPDEIVAAYKELGRAFLLACSSLSDEQVIGFMFLLSSLGHQTFMGSMDIMRGHPTDSTSHPRKSIEAAAFCLELLADQDSAKRWLQAGTSKGAMKKYRSRFPAWQVVDNRLKPRDTELIDIYENYCLTVHPGLASVSRQAVINGQAFQFDHLEVSNQDDHDNLKSQYLLALTTHIRIIDVLAKALEELKFPLAANFHSQFGSVQSKVQQANLAQATYMQGKMKP